MREVRTERRIPKFRPLPTNLRRPVEHRMYKRFYGNCNTKTGKIKKFIFEVELPNSFNGKMKHRAIRYICEKIKYEKSIPLLKKGERVRLSDLMLKVPWIRVRKIRVYETQSVYEHERRTVRPNLKMPR
jgi:hypothetical protein